MKGKSFLSVIDLFHEASYVIRVGIDFDLHNYIRYNVAYFSQKRP